MEFVRNHRRLLLVIAVLAVIAAGTAGWFAYEWQHRGPTAASVDQAVDRFRSTPTATATPSDRTPAPGVYTFDGDGTESLSFLSTQQSQGPTLPATITPDGHGCWRFVVEYNTFHTQGWDWCRDGARIREGGGTTVQKFDFVAYTVDEHSTITCDPPFVIVDTDAHAGDTTTSNCKGHSTTTNGDMVTTGTVRFVAREQLTVDGTTVPVLHYRADRIISGDQTGHESSDFWFATDDGMLVRNERDIEVASPAPAPLNSVTYREHGWFQLASLTPRS
jgi:hypothetical protein